MAGNLLQAAVNMVGMVLRAFLKFQHESKSCVAIMRIYRTSGFFRHGNQLDS